MTNHHYAPLLRPASFCTLPDGIDWEYVEAPDYLPAAPAPRSKLRHGIIRTSRKLTAEECKHFDLKPL